MRDALVVACAALSIALLWLPYYRDALAGVRLAPLDFTDEVALLLWPLSVLTLVVGSGVLVAAAHRRERAAEPAGVLRRIAFYCAAAAALLGTANGVLRPTRTVAAQACGRIVDTDVCSPFAIEWVPSAGYLLALGAAVTTMIVLAPDAKLTGPRWNRPALAPALGAVATMAALATSFLPVYRHYPAGPKGARELPAIDWSPWHGLAAPIAILLVAMAGLVMAAPNVATRSYGAPLAAVGLLATVVSAFAVPVDTSGSYRVETVDDTRTVLAMTWPGWGWFGLVGAALLVVAGALFGRVAAPAQLRRGAEPDDLVDAEGGAGLEAG